MRERQGLHFGCKEERGNRKKKRKLKRTLSRRLKKKTEKNKENDKQETEEENMAKEEKGEGYVYEDEEDKVTGGHG